MSFILEALKKSAREREREQIPTLEANHQIENSLHFSRPGAGSMVKRIILSIIVLLPVLLLGTWYGQEIFFPKTDIKKIQHQSATSDQNLFRNQENNISSKNIGRGKKKNELLVVDTEVGSEPTHSPDDSVQPSKNEINTTTQKIDLHKENQNNTNLISTESNESVPPLLKFLPEEVRNEIPEIKFSGHAYSDDPAKRMIMINQKIVREMDIIEPKLRLEAIILNGIILDYDSTRFRIEMFK